MNMERKSLIRPTLGIAKGIIIILLGFIWWDIVSLGSFMQYVGSGNKNMLTVGAIQGLVFLGFGFWRGVVAIRSRKTKELTNLNFGLWLLLFCLTLAFVLFVTFR
jgi:hypothetical protein